MGHTQTSNCTFELKTDLLLAKNCSWHAIHNKTVLSLNQLDNTYLLFVFTDPLFPLNFLVNSWVPSMFDSVFQASFLCALLLFWLCAFHGIRQVGESEAFITVHVRS